MLLKADVSKVSYPIPPTTQGRPRDQNLLILLGFVAGKVFREEYWA
jgi:hypothetical protein